MNSNPIEKKFVGNQKKASGGRIFLGFLMFIPLALIIYFVTMYYSSSMNPEDVKKVSIETPATMNYEYTDSENIEFFITAINNSRSLQEPLRPIENEKPVVISCDRGDKIITYSLYPELKTSGCLLLSSDGKYSVVDTDTAKDLLSREELQYLYADRFLPSLTLVSGEQHSNIAPAEYQWNYTYIDGSTKVEYTDTAFYEEGNDLFIYSVWENRIEFSVKPTNQTIEFFDSNGAVLPLTEISKFIFETDMIIRAKVVAEWSEAEYPDYSGSAVFEFDFLYDVPAHVLMSSATAKQGELIYLTVDHLNDGESLLIDSDFISGSATLYKQNDKTFALLPVSAETAEGVHTISFTTGKVGQSLDVTILSGNFISKNMTVSEELFNANWADEKQSEAASVLDEIFGITESNAYFTNGAKFNAPVSAAAEVKFGTKISYASGELSEDIISHGNLYKTASSLVACAVKGRVAFTGEIPGFGKTMVVDHGLGVFTVYYYLQEYNKEVGELVSTGENIGRTSAADSPFEASLGFAVCVNKVFVSPDVFFQNGINVN